MTCKTKQRQTLKIREKILIFFLITAALLTVFWQFYGMTHYNNLKELMQKQNDLAEEIRGKNEILKIRENIENEWAGLKDEAEIYNTALPHFSELPSVFGRLEKVLNKHGSSVRLVRAGNINHESEHITIAISLQAEANPQRLQTILNDLEQFEHLVVIDNLSWFNGNNSETMLDLSFYLCFDNKE